jgi:hypothetical protein
MHGKVPRQMTNHNPLSHEELTRVHKAFKRLAIACGKTTRQMFKAIKPFTRLYLEMNRGPSIGRKRRSRRARGRARERDKS